MRGWVTAGLPQSRYDARYQRRPAAVNEPLAHDEPDPMSTSSHDDSTNSSPDQLQDAAVPHRIVARRGDGSAYQGDLLRDIVRYRNLRALSLAG